MCQNSFGIDATKVYNNSYVDLNDKFKIVLYIFPTHLVAWTPYRTAGAKPQWKPDVL